MTNILKLMYVVVAPAVLILVYEKLIVTHWVRWVADVPELAGCPSWPVLAVAGALYAINVWMLIKKP